jgi:lipopolysaccharide transport system ATP-binding protein
MSETLVRAEGVSKKFCKSLKRSMLYGVEEILKNALNWDAKETTLRPGEFWAVDGVSFELRRGECIGLIGPNGSGKSTLLKMLNGILMPDRGSIKIAGRVGALIELGAGFHPMLTGRENIYINGAILGFSKKEIKKKFDAIVAFSELADFIDTPVKHFSSGMYVRLGFAVAAHMEPDVLLIDEVLAVGDVGFRAKCYLTIAEKMKNCAVIFVSHHMPQIAKLCTKVLVLNHGNAVSISDPSHGIEHYNSLFPDTRMTIAGTGEAHIENLRLLNVQNRATDTFMYNEAMRIMFDVQVADNYEEFLVSITFMSSDTNLIAQCHSKYNNTLLTNSGKPSTVSVTIQNLTLNPGTYYVNIIIFDKSNVKHLLWMYGAKKVIIKGDFLGGAPVQYNAVWKQVQQ